MRKGICGILALLILVGAIGFIQAPVAQAVPLNHGVDCSSRVVVVSWGVWPGGSSTFHTISCNRAVEMLVVQAAQSQESDGSLYYYRSNTCYNASTCAVSIDSTISRMAFGHWLYVTAGTAGRPGNPQYYGYVPESSIWAFCDGISCRRL